MSAQGWLAAGLRAEAETLRKRADRSRRRGLHLECVEHANACIEAADAYDAAARLLIGRAIEAESRIPKREKGEGK